MATVTGQTLSFPPITDVSQNIIPSALEPVSIGRYRITRRRARVMLSDGGIVVPSCSTSTPPVLHTGFDISSASLIIERNSLLRQTSRTDCSTSDQNIHRQTSVMEDVRASDSGYDDDHQVSHTIPPNIASVSSSASFSQDQKTSTFLRSSKDNIKERKPSSSDVRSSAPLDFQQGKIQTHESVSVWDQRDRDPNNKHILHPPSRLDVTEDITAGQGAMTTHDSSTVNVTETMQVKRALHSESAAGSPASTKAPKIRSLSVVEMKSASLKREGNKKDNKKTHRLSLVNTESGPTSYGGHEDLIDPKKLMLAPESTHRNRSKFLTELYMGAEKIKRFINRGKIKKDTKASFVSSATKLSERQNVNSHLEEVFTFNQNELNNQMTSVVNTDTLLENESTGSPTVNESSLGHEHFDSENKPASNTPEFWKSEAAHFCSYPQDYNKPSLRPDVLVSGMSVEQAGPRRINKFPSVGDISIPKLKLQHKYSFGLVQPVSERQWKVQETQVVHSRRRCSHPDMDPAVEDPVKSSIDQGYDKPGLCATSRHIRSDQYPSNYELLSDPTVTHVSNIATAGIVKHSSDNTENNSEFQNEAKIDNHNIISTLPPSFMKSTFDNTLDSGNCGSPQSNILTNASPHPVEQMTVERPETFKTYTPNTATSVSGNSGESSQMPAGSFVVSFHPASSGQFVAKHASYDKDSYKDETQLPCSLPASDCVIEENRIGARIKFVTTDFLSRPRVTESPVNQLGWYPVHTSDLVTSPRQDDAPVHTSDLVASLRQDDAPSVAPSQSSSKYDEIRSLPELQRLLSETQDPADRRTIRNAIRRLRYRPESVPLCREFQLHPDQRQSSTKPHSQTHKLSPLDCGRLDSHALPPLTGILLYSADVHGNTPAAAKFTQNESTSDQALTGGEGQSHSFGTNNNSTCTEHRVVLNSINVDQTTADKTRQYSNKEEDVSRVVEYVKARLKSRSESLTAESNISNVSASVGRDSLSPTSGPVSKVKAESIGHSAEGHSDKRASFSSGDLSPSRLLGRSSENASEKYKEARDQILRSSNIKNLSTRRSDTSVLTELHIQPSSRYSLGSSPPLLASLTTLSVNHTSADNEVSANRSPRVLQENDAKDKKIYDVEWKPDQHNITQGGVTSSLGQHKLPAEVVGVTETSVSTKPYLSTLTAQRPTGTSNCVILDVPESGPETLTDIQKLEKGQSPSKSKALVNSLATTFSGNPDTRLPSTNLQRSRSLNLKYVSSSIFDRNRDNLPLHVTLTSSSQVQHGVNYTDIVIKNDQNSHFPQKTPEYRTRTSLPDSVSSQTTENSIQNSVYSEPKSSCEFSQRRAPDVELPTMQRQVRTPTKRSRPLGRSLTESHITRPQVYTSHLEILMVPKTKDTSDCNCNVSDELAQRHVGNIPDPFAGDSGLKKEDYTAEPSEKDSDLSRSFLTRSLVQLSNVDLSSPITSPLVLAKKMTDIPYKQMSTIETDVNLTGDARDTLRDAERQEELAFSASQSNVPCVYSRQPTTSMEKAFSLLLEELDKISGSEGNPSDPDISDNEDLVTMTSGSRSVENNAALESHTDRSTYASGRSARDEDGPITVPSNEPKFESRLDLDGVNADDRGRVPETGPPVSVVTRGGTSGPVSEVNSCMRVVTHEVQGGVTLLLQTNLKENVRSQRVPSSLTVSASGHSALSETDTKLEPDDSSALAQEAYTLPAEGHTVTPQEDSTVDRMLPVVSETTEEKSVNTSVNNYTADRIIHCNNNNVTDMAETSTIYTDNGARESMSSDQVNHSYTSHTGIGEGDTTDGVNSDTSTSAQLGLTDPDNFLSCRTFDVSEHEDGTITLQAVAEDHNQNQVVTVRTKKLRTPSNANEELRDTIVERKKISPGGGVLVERDVIQTKNRLTSRGSNYYTRSAYTLRTRREQGGTQTVEHNVCVENENKSVSQGQSWGDRAEAQVTLVDAGSTALVPQLPSAATAGDTNGTALVQQLPSPATVGDTNGTASVSQLPSPATVGDTNGTALVSQLPSPATVGDPSVSAATMRDQDYRYLDSHTCKSSDGQNNGVSDMKITPGRREQTVDVSQALPTFEQRLSDVSVTEGHSTIFSCIVTGAVCVEWYHNGALKRNSADFKQSYDGREARLQIAEVFLDDAGQYTCIAKNSSGEQRTVCSLHVIACDQETVVVPMFLTKLTSRVVTEGEMLLLECDVIGSPEPTITWLKDGQQLGSTLTYSACYDGRVASLQISAMRFEDRGCYMCLAENPAGKVSIDATVNVQVKNQAPQFVTKLVNKSVVSGEPIVLQCEITGSPLPTVLWRKDGRLIQTSNNCIQSFHSGVARLEIKQATSQDSACYECVAKNAVSEISCTCQVQVVHQPKHQPEETTAPRNEQIITSLQKVTRHRVGHKLSEPRPADIIAAVIQRASSHGVQRAQTFTPGSSTFNKERFMVGQAVQDKSNNSQLQNVFTTVNQPQTLSVVRNTITVSPRSDIPTRHTEPSTTSLQRNELGSNLDVQTEKHNGISRAPSFKATESSPHPATTSLRATNLSRSASMNIGRSSNQSSYGHNIQSSGSVKSLWTSPSTDQLAPRETITKSFSHEVVSELRPLSPIVGYRTVLPAFSDFPDKENLAHSSSVKYLSLSGGNVSNSPAETVLTKHAAEKHRNYVPTTSSTSSSSSLRFTRSKVTETTDHYTLSATPSPMSAYSMPISKLAEKSPAPGISHLNPDTSPSRVQSPSVNALRQHFLKNDLAVTTSGSPNSMRNTSVGVRRWDSLPPQTSKPIVFQRKSTVAASSLPIMPSYDTITDEEELQKMMNATEDFEERKKIRARIREIREKQREEQEAKRKQREAEAEDLVKKKFQRAEEEKRKKMEAYKQQAPTHERDSKYHDVSQKMIQEKYKAAEEEKAKKLAAYNKMATTTTTTKGPDGVETTTTTSYTTESTPGGGTRAVMQKSTESKGFGGTSYGKPAEVTARELTEKLMRSSGPGIIGHVTVRTEAWNSTNGLVEKSEKSHSWGAKPQGAKSAMAAFKQLDTTNNPDSAAKPKALARSPTAIKQILLDWTKAMTQGYPGVEVTNFSTSWNNGMAFCALIHHFYPNAFDFSKLDPKQRRYNFTLAFDTAEKEADIAPLLDVEDMVKMKNPDWKCVFTYVQSIYRHLRDHENNKVRPVEQ